MKITEAIGGNLKHKCQFVVPKKNRPCRMFALEDEKLCGEHIVLDTEHATRQNSVPEDRIRIKCPLDPSHTCFLKKLERHLKVCNAREKERPPYYVRDINAGDNVPQPEGQTIHQLSDRALLELLDKISTLHAEHVSPAEVAEEATHAALADSLQNPAYGADTLKHLRQNSALLAVLRDAGQLDGESTFVELGSGKAQLSFWLARAVSSRSQIVLVDFASHRHKAENKLKDLADMPAVQRLKIDIRHLSLTGCEACHGRGVVAISKHLCGAATDLGIRAVTTAMNIQSPTEAGGAEPAPEPAAAASEPAAAASEPAAAAPEPAAAASEPAAAAPEPAAAASEPAAAASEPAAATSEPAAAASTGPPSGDRPGPPSGDRPGPSSGDRPGQSSGDPSGEAADVRGVMIAVCCHHRVDWPSFVGKQFLQEVCRFSAADFTALKGVAAWATCGTPSWDADALHRSGIEDRRRRASADSVTGTGAYIDTDTGSTEGNGAEPPPDADTPPTDSGRLAAERTESAPARAVEGSSPAAAPELQKRPGAAGEHDDAKRRRLDGLAATADLPGPGSRQASAGRYQRLRLTPERRTNVGLQCKRLLDEGRRRYLQQQGFAARMVRYVPASVSPENVLLLATR